eukprot:6220978-Pyramimonas_sp.AAC.2
MVPMLLVLPAVLLLVLYVWLVGPQCGAATASALLATPLQPCPVSEWALLPALMLALHLPPPPPTELCPLPH